MKEVVGFFFGGGGYWVFCVFLNSHEKESKRKKSSIQQTHKNTNLSRMKRISEWGLF